MANKYVFVEKNIIQIQQNHLLNFTFSNEWIEITPRGRIIIKGTNKEGYAWNGCSPKLFVGDIFIGTPDGRVDISTGHPLSYYASMFHDALYQFLKHKHPLITRKECDLIFYDLLVNAGFKYARIYYLAVRALGWFWWYFKK